MSTATTVSTLTVAAPATPTCGPAGADTGAQDFLMMLAQFLGEAAPATPETPVVPELVAQALADAADDVGDDAAPGIEGAALAALVPSQLPTSTPVAPVVDDAQVDEILSIAGRSSQTEWLAGARMLEELTQSEDPTAIDSQAGPDAPQFNLAPTPDKLAVATPTNPERDPLLSRPIQAPVGSAAWADEISARLTWMAEQGKHSASLRLSPEHLGPLEIRIAMNDDKASVWFGAAHADTRAAIEHALPRLRELFSSQGLSLADAGVFREPPREQAWNEARGIDNDDRAAGESTSAIVRARIGLVDAYA